MTQRLPVDISAVQAACRVVHKYVTPCPLLRSYALEKLLQVEPHRRVWIKDYGWSPVGSFKVMGALNWMAQNASELGGRPVAAHSSGNFASGISFAGAMYGQKVIIVMPDTAPKIKFERTRSYGAEIRTYEIATDHLTGAREKMARHIAENENAKQASPYDDVHVIAGNGVGGLEIAASLQDMGRNLSNFLCPVSGGGLMAGHAVALHDAFPEARIIGVEPELADDFRRSLEAGERTRLERPSSICDGLLSYDVGVNNWPILQALVQKSVPVSDSQTKTAMRWLYENHGLRVEPSGAISIASAIFHRDSVQGDGDIVLVISGRNIDQDVFERHILEGNEALPC